MELQVIDMVFAGVIMDVSYIQQVTPEVCNTERAISAQESGIGDIES